MVRGTCNKDGSTRVEFFANSSSCGGKASSVMTFKKNGCSSNVPISTAGCGAAPTQKPTAGKPTQKPTTGKPTTYPTRRPTNSPRKCGNWRDGAVCLTPFSGAGSLTYMSDAAAKNASLYCLKASAKHNSKAQHGLCERVLCDAFCGTVHGSECCDLRTAEFDRNSKSLKVTKPMRCYSSPVLSPRTPSLFYIENTSVHRKGV